MRRLTSHLHVRVELIIDDVAWVTVCGEVDPETSEPLFEALVAVLSVDDVRQVEVDLANVTFLDASGVGVLLAAQNRAYTASKLLSVCGATAMPLQVLEFTGVLQRLYGEVTGADLDGRTAPDRRSLLGRDAGR